MPVNVIVSCRTPLKLKTRWWERLKKQPNPLELLAVELVCSGFVEALSGIVSAAIKDAGMQNGHVDDVRVNIAPLHSRAITSVDLSIAVEFGRMESSWEGLLYAQRDVVREWLAQSMLGWLKPVEFGPATIEVNLCFNRGMCGLVIQLPHQVVREWGGDKYRYRSGARSL